MKFIPYFLAFTLLFQIGVGAETLLPLDAIWKYKKGTEEASDPPEAWRGPGYDDESWASGETPVYYGENLSGGTTLPDMRYSYTTIYLRNTFQIADPAEIDRLALRVHCDDGFIAWINGQEAVRYNVNAGHHAYDGRAQGAGEPVWVTNSLSTPSAYLVPGENVIAVHLFNANLTSSDIVFNLQLDSAIDRVPPEITRIEPAPGQVEELRQITVHFSEPVQGVSPQDLLINNTPAAGISGEGATYIFTFDPPPYGPVDISWDPGHLIQDLADPPHDLDHTAASASWSYELRDTTPPRLAQITPPPGITVRSLSQVELRFSEEVQGVDASDLLINGVPALSVETAGLAHLFHFPSQSAGRVEFSWVPSHGITDLALPPNSFISEGWSCEVDPEAPLPSVVISEFITSQESSSGLEDEDGALQDWIELHNTTAAPVNLAGWSLTDDDAEPGLWVFPDITIPAGGRLVVFASGKNRKEGQNLHTNFKLGTDGEYLALFNPESPRAALTEFADEYPEQRNDYSYGLDEAGLWRYFPSPTPGQPNGSSSILGIVPPPTPNIERGTYEESFTLELTTPMASAEIRYTTDGSPPTETTGHVYTGPFTISRTTPLRAAAFAPSFLPSEIITHTYIFLDQVLQQPNNPPGFPTGPRVLAGYPSDYEMDPEIVNHPDYKDDMKAALQALPVLSVVMETEDLFDPETGIYIHPLNRGPEWERPCSVEFMPLDGNGFHVNAGIQIQGNAARQPIKTPKHPFRLVFKGDYGPKNLEYRMFPDSPADVFDTLILRADFNYSWLHWNGIQRIRAQRTRDAWMKDSMRAMGGLASHNRYVHLYINGLYWGIYDPSERPDGAFGAAYLGGEKEDYDVINEGEVVDGGIAAYNTMRNFSNLQDPVQYEAFQSYLDLTQFIDYMLLHFYAGHQDWFNNKNWYALRPKDGSRGFIYVPWDGEMILGEPGVNRVSDGDYPSGLHAKLLASPEYRLAFADRVQKHLFNGGALTPEKAAERWMKRAREVELPIIAESARWGDYRRDLHQYSSGPYQLYTRNNQWRAEQQRLLTIYFPNRTTTLLRQLRSAGLFPDIAGAAFNQYGGLIRPGFELIMSAPSGEIYYTTDGSDPRIAFTGEVSPSAQRYSGALALEEGAVVKARVRQGSEWSALTEALFITQGPSIPLRITEILYHPEPPGDEYEFIEIQNIGSIPVETGSFYLTGVDYVFPPHTSIAPGQIILIASGSNPTAFAQRYPGVPVFGYFGGQLVNRGERLALATAERQTIVSVDYGDSGAWPIQADGGGFSLEIIDPFADPDDPANWRASVEINGSPGLANPPSAAPAVRLNEVQAAHSTEADWLEFRNSSAAAADLSAWRLADSGADQEFIFPAGTRLQPGEFLIVHCGRQPGAPGFHAPFGLDAESETIVLRDASGARVDVLTYGPQIAGRTLGLIDGDWTLTEPTPAAENQPVLLGSATTLVLNELFANPAAGGDDWIELFNAHSLRPVALRGLFISTGAQLFEITSHSFIPPAGFVRFIADENPGADHLDLKLPAGGAAVSLLDPAGAVLDEIAYADQPEGNSFGRFPNGTDNIVAFDLPTPRASNSFDFQVEHTFAAGTLTLEWPAAPGKRYRIEFSPDLSSWSELTEVTAESSSAQVQHQPDSTAGYFRVIALP